MYSPILLTKKLYINENIHSILFYIKEVGLFPSCVYIGKFSHIVVLELGVSKPKQQFGTLLHKESLSSLWK